MTRDNDLKFIKDFSKINISQICKDLNVDRSNVLCGRASKETTSKVRKEIEKRLATLQG